MKKIFLLSLCLVSLLLAGCFKFTPQAEYEAEQKALQDQAQVQAQDNSQVSSTTSTTSTVDGTLSLGEVEVKSETATVAPVTEPDQLKIEATVKTEAETSADDSTAASTAE